MVVLRGKIFLLMVAACAGMLGACDRNRIFDENRIMARGTWNASGKIRYYVNIGDINYRYNLYLKVRNGSEYPFSNLYLFMTTTRPDGIAVRDTLELTLADYDGRWLGSGAGNVKFSKFLLRQGTTFDQKGVYIFQFEQAMRVNELKGIRDFGLRIEKE